VLSLAGYEEVGYTVRSADRFGLKTLSIVNKNGELNAYILECILYWNPTKK
jgi:hypothetical protein